ncbi:hypothetical protein MHEL_59880 [Mycolicibacterium helvum]|uniref:Uncharacterized protein n=1 Tax=Mycolicibacterium helvum TaxID=1534349 RepID=A0A7I7TH68_9MYCO|nr:hypothetical protein MHEL_59880 [Mycolicibacterium helvum]
MVAQFADQKLRAEPATTDIYFEIETSDGQLIQRRGTPTFSGESLDVDDQQWPAGRWKRLTVHPSGWAPPRTATPSSAPRPKGLSSWTTQRVASPSSNEGMAQ